MVQDRGVFMQVVGSNAFVKKSARPMFDFIRTKYYVLKLKT